MTTNRVTLSCHRCGAVSVRYPGSNYCARCATPLIRLDTTSQLLDKLSQLARFGLAAEDPPLLEPVGED